MTTLQVLQTRGKQLTDDVLSLASDEVCAHYALCDHPTRGGHRVGDCTGTYMAQVQLKGVCSCGITLKPGYLALLYCAVG